jgi:protein gp37
VSTKIEWTQETWNVVSGCTKISPGCAHCYAERMARRLAGRCGYPERPHHFDVTLHPDKLDLPLKWRRPRTVFVCSMSDLFHEDVPRDFIDDVFGIMRRSFLSTFKDGFSTGQHHIFQVLTKRPERMAKYLEHYYALNHEYHPWPNIWLGVTAENQRAADERIPVLLQIPAAVRFVSVEPMLGAVGLSPYLPYMTDSGALDPNTGAGINVEVPGLDWVICGGESGPGARPMHPDWARGLRDQCQAAGVPFFFKQWGAWSHDSMHIVNKQPGKYAFAKMDYPGYKSLLFARVGKKRAGRLLDGREWNEMPHQEDRRNA